MNWKEALVEIMRANTMDGSPLYKIDTDGKVHCMYLTKEGKLIYKKSKWEIEWEQREVIDIGEAIEHGD